MKNFVKIGAVSALAVLALASCKKEYNCSCTLDGQPNTSFQYQMSEEAATAACASDEFLLQQENPTSIVACSID